MSYFASKFLLPLTLFTTFAACSDDRGVPEHDDAAIADARVAPDLGPPVDPKLVEAIDKKDPFISVFRDDGAAIPRAAAAALGGPQSPAFQLAIRKDALSEKWLLSTYLRHFSQGNSNPALVGLAARSLGMQVVSFRLSNGRLLVLDQSTGRKWSDAFDPEALLEAYPLVTDFADWQRIPGADAYVLFDPARGMNRFAIETTTGQFTGLNQLAVDLSYVQNFRRMDDGIGFEQVFTGYQVRGTSQTRLSGSLGVSLRRYADAPDFMPREIPLAEQQAPFFFTANPPQLIPNEGRTKSLIARWPLDRNKPIKWTVSASVDTSTKAYERFGIDVFSAVKRGIESWNKIFGFTALVVEKAAPSDTLTDADRNIFYWDSVPNGLSAFADFRAIPGTGEIRGASVYMPASFIESAILNFAPDMVRPPNSIGQDATFFGWSGLAPQTLCTMPSHDIAGATIDTGDAATQIAGLSLKEKLERRIVATAAHEIGHTLGLRHNFKGSLVPPSSSIMEYSDSNHRVAAPLPGDYDAEAIAYLYSGGPVPTLPFCTEGQGRDPTCAPFDATNDPMRAHHGVRWSQGLARWFVESNTREALDLQSIANEGLTGLNLFLRNAAPGDRLEAFGLIVSPFLKPEIPPNAPAFSQVRLDQTVRNTLRTLYPEPSLTMTPVPNVPIPLAGELPKQMAEFFQNLLIDGKRTIELRRLTVDTMRRMQHVEGLRLLREAREILIRSRTTTTAEALLLLDDLVARIDRALAPYFDS